MSRLGWRGKEMKFNNEEAVSPVIGVILMVAITVILAAVIAVFVFSMAEDIQTTHVVSLTAQGISGNMTVTFNGGSGASDIESIKITAYKADGTLDSTAKFPVKGSSTAAFDAGVGTWDDPKIGEKITIVGSDTTALPVNERFVFVGTFSDGSEQIILDKSL